MWEDCRRDQYLIFGSEEIHINSEYFEIVKDILTSVHSSIQMEIAAKKKKKRLKLREPAMEELGKTIKSKDMLLETKIKVIHILIFPVSTYRCEPWQCRRLIGK